MASPAMNVFHSVVCYKWQCNGYDCHEETPIMYAAREGVYICHIVCENPVVQMKTEFSVQSELFCNFECVSYNIIPKEIMGW